MTELQHGIGWLNRPGTIGQSWSPMVGCSRVSEGCRNCYAERMAARIANAAAARLREGKAITATQRAYMWAVRWDGGAVGVGKALPRWSGRVELVPELLAKPLGWRRPRTVFPSCRGAGVPVYVKQLGSRPSFDGRLDGWAEHVEFRKDLPATNVIALRDPKGADPSEWPEDLRVQQWPEAA